MVHFTFDDGGLHLLKVVDCRRSVLFTGIAAWLAALVDLPPHRRDILQCIANGWHGRKSKAYGVHLCR